MCRLDVEFDRHQDQELVEQDHNKNMEEELAHLIECQLQQVETPKGRSLIIMASKAPQIMTFTT
jgi:hypothetical protein